PLVGPAGVGLAGDPREVRSGLAEVGEGRVVDDVAVRAAHVGDQVPADLLGLGGRRPGVGGVAGDAAGLAHPLRQDGVLEVGLLHPTVAPLPVLPLLGVDRAVAGAREVGGAVEAAVAGGAAVAGVGMGRAVADEGREGGMGAEGLLPLRPVEPGAVGG